MHPSSRAPGTLCVCAWSKMVTAGMHTQACCPSYRLSSPHHSCTVINTQCPRHLCIAQGVLVTYATCYLCQPVTFDTMGVIGQRHVTLLLYGRPNTAQQQRRAVLNTRTVIHVRTWNTCAPFRSFSNLVDAKKFASAPARMARVASTDSHRRLAPWVPAQRGRHRRVYAHDPGPLLRCCSCAATWKCTPAQVLVAARGAASVVHFCHVRCSFAVVM